MERITLQLLAWFLAIAHPIITLTILFGWLIPEISYWYIAVLTGTALSWILAGHCVLSVWEFRIRKKLDPDLEEYEHLYIHYHMRKWVGYAPPVSFIKTVGYVFIGVSIFVWIIKYFDFWRVIQ